MYSQVSPAAIANRWLHGATTLIVLSSLLCVIASPAPPEQHERDIRGRVSDAINLLPKDTKAAVARLRSLGTPALEYIAEAIQSRADIPQLQKALLLAVIADSKGEKHYAALIHLLNATDPFIRGSAISILGKRRYKPAIPFMVRLLNDKDTYMTRSQTDPYYDQHILVRDMAIEALETTTKMVLAGNADSDEKANAWRRWWEKKQKTT